MAIIGRDVELEATAAAFKRGARVVTLVGGPGTGKSALASAFGSVSRDLRVARCDLGGARSALELAAAVAQALSASLGAADGERAIAELLGRVLGQRGPQLVVLDGADGVTAPLSRALASWVTLAPEARFLVTSRARLGGDVEASIEVPPLPVPNAGEEDAAVIEATAAVRLFAARAEAARPGYRIPAREIRTVAEIVRRLDGIPLAIELCAARVPVLGERALAELLAERFDVLDAESTATQGRTLSRAIAWSWDLLDEDGRRALARCSVFEGSFDLAAAAAIGAGRGARQPKAAAAAELEKLESRSLLTAFEPEALPGERRFTMLGSVRAYARERLAESGDEHDAELRHARHFATLPEAAPSERIARLSLERADLASAFRIALAQGDDEAATQLALRAEPLALAHGPLAPYLAMLDALFARKGLAPALAAPLHLSRGLATLFRGRRDLAVPDFEAAKKLAERAGLTDVRVLATSKLGLVAGLKGGTARARRIFAEATKVRGASGKARGVVLKDLANVLSEAGANDEAMVTLARARDVLHEAGEIREEGFVTMLVGSRLFDEGRLADAKRDLEAALALLRRAGDKRSEAWTTVLLAMAESEQGAHERARAKLEASARTFHAIGDSHTEGLVLAFAGNVALEQRLLGDAERAYREARQLLEAAGDEGSLALVLAAASVVDASLGHEAAAKDGAARATKVAAADGRAARKTAIRVLTAATAAIMRAAGDEASARKLVKAEPGDAEEVRFARRVLLTALSGPPESSPEALAAVVAAKDGAWVRLAGGDVVRLARSKTLKAVVERLVTERLQFPGRAVQPSVLVRAGWPGERILPAAAKNRLHVTMTRLRRMGLGDLIVHEDDGYLLDPKVDLRLGDDL